MTETYVSDARDKPVRKQRSGCRWFFTLSLISLLGFSVLLNVGLLAHRFFEEDRSATSARPVDEFPVFRSTWSFGDGETRVVRIPLQGLIMRGPEGGLFGSRHDRVELILNRIRAATNDETVHGIILEVDSPGGAVTPSDEIFRALQRFRESSPDRRVLIFTRDMAASGAYYAAMAGDWIMAEPTALIGSIGVLIQSLNWHELSRRIGVTDVTIKSGDNKDLLNPFQPTSAEDIDHLQAVVDAMFNRFAGIVQESRDFDDEAMDRIADGRIFSATDALAEGLIDQIGYWDEAVEMMAELLGVPNVRVTRYERRTDWTDLFAGLRQEPFDLRTALPHLDRPRLLYLWQP